MATQQVGKGWQHQILAMYMSTLWEAYGWFFPTIVKQGINFQMLAQAKGEERVFSGQ